MLVLTRRVGEEIVIGNNIRLTVVRVEGGKARLGVDAPASVRVVRAEIRAKPRSEVVLSTETTNARTMTAGKS